MQYYYLSTSRTINQSINQSINQQRRHHYDRDNCYCTGVTQEHSCHFPSADTVDTVNRLTVTGQKKKRENRIKLLLVIL
jgi:hypothetical protein